MNEKLDLAIEAFRNKENQQARAYLEPILQNEPDNPQALELLGLIMAEREGRLEEGVALIERALALSHYDMWICLHLMQLHINTRRQDLAHDVFLRAKRILDDVLASDPNSPIAVYWLITLLCALDLVEQVHIYREHALAVLPYNSDVWHGLARHYLRVGQVERAEEALWHLVSIGQNPEAKKLLAACFKSQNKVIPAIALYQWAQQEDPEMTWLPFWEGELHLIQGYYEQGWPLYFKHYGRYNARFEKGQEVEGKYKLKRSDDLKGKVVRVFCDQGIGDSIMYLRYLPLLKAMGAEIQLGIRATLIRLTQSLGVVSGFFIEDAYAYGLAEAQVQLPQQDYVISLSTLAYTFETQINTIPYAAKYLESPAERRSYWRARLHQQCGGRQGVKKIGLIWAGNPVQEFDGRRSLPFKKFASLLDLPQDVLERVQFFSLQKFVRATDIEDLSQSRVIHWMDEVGDYADTGALMQELDLVISVCTSGVHAAGALGVPVWVLLSFATDWRWHLDQGEWAEKSPWYLSATLLRQKQINGWEALLDKARERLIDFVMT